MEFIKRLRQKLNEFYNLDDTASVKRSALGDEIDGYLEAGILLNVITEEEFLTIADEEHLSVYGISLKQRKLNLSCNLTQQERDWEKYNQPTYIRKNCTKIL